MIFHFRTNNVTFFPEDQEYFETKFRNLKKFLGHEVGDKDTVDVTVNIEKNKHGSGERFEASANVVTPNHGKFHSEVAAENIKKCADMMYAKLQPQVEKFHSKHISS